MTRVQIYTKDGIYRSFSCIGHADYAASGADIVCAGISALVISTINSLEDLLHEKIEVDLDEENGGYIAVNFLEDPSEKGSFLIDHLIYGMDWIQSQYGKKYLSYEIKEV